MRAPFVARWLMRLLAPPGEADALIDDLEQEARQILAASSLRAARRWMWWQAMHSAWPLARQQMRARRARQGELDGSSRSVDRPAARPPPPPAGARLHGGGGVHARHRHRHRVGDLQSRLCDLAEAASVPRRGSPGHDSEYHAKSGDVATVVSGPEIADYRDGAASVAILGGVRRHRPGRTNWRRADSDRRRTTRRPTFSTYLGATPALGRTFSASDAGQPVVILSHATWVSRFGKDPNVLSRTFELSGQPFSIIGVMPRGFRFPQILESDLWTASSFASWTDRSQRYLQLVARLPPGATIDQASREVAAVAARLARAYPATNDGWSAKVLPLDDRRAAGYGAIFGSLLGIVGLFLLVGCANLAGLLVARNMDRRGELAVCASLGATRWRLARQLTFEAGVIALAGALAGLALSSPASRALAAVMPPRLPGLDDVQLSWPVLAFAIAVSVVTALLCGVLPALSLGTVSASEALTGPRRSGPRSQRLQNMLVVAEVAAAMMLVVGATLMTQAFSTLLNRDRGFNPHGMFALNVSLPFEQDKYLDESLRAATLDAIVLRVAALPGVAHVGATNGFPGSALGILGSVMLRPGAGAARAEVSSALRSATPDYFAAMGVAVKSWPRVSRGRYGSSAARRRRERDARAGDVAGWPSHRQGRSRFLPATIAVQRTTGRSSGSSPTCTSGRAAPPTSFCQSRSGPRSGSISSCERRATRRRSPSPCGARCVNSIPIC